MICKTYSPMPELAPYIKSYILVEDLPGVMKGKRMAIFPSGHLEMIFSYGDDVHFSNNYYLRHGHGYLSGQILEPLYYRCSGSLKVISIIFRPWAIYRFLGIPQSALANTPMDLGLLLKKDNNITQRIADEQDHEKKVSILDRHFLSLLGKVDAVLDPVSASAEIIAKSGGNMAIGDLCSLMNISSRTLERRFRNMIGLTPKALSMMIRFNNAFNDIQSGRFRDIHDIIHRHGYYDQSHFINQFKKYTGLLPSSFLDTPKEMNHSLREIVTV